MPLGLGSALFACILPVEKTNYILNSSFEYGTTGVAAIQAATIGSSAQFQQFGAWSCSVTPNSNGTSGGAFGTWTASNGSAYTVSAYVRGASGVPYMIGVGDSNGVNLVGSTAFTGGGTWQYVSYAFTEAAGAVRRVVIRKTSGNDTTAYYVDGVQAEMGSLTTYFDGDQPGGTWQGAPHASSSFRTGQYRGGGSVVALADLGLSVDQMPGAGVPPIEVSTQSYAVIDGAEFQRQRAAQRQFSLTAKPLFGTTLADFHVTRRTLWDAFKPDAVTPQQPIRFLYVGGQGTIQVDAYYQSGLELGNMDGPIAETLGVSFVATDPYWYAPTQQGTTLVPNIGFGSANYIIKRSPLGAWGTLGSNGTSVDGTVYDFAFDQSGIMYLGGTFLTAGGTTAPRIALYNPTTNAFGTLDGGGTVQAAYVQALAFNAAGSLYFAGSIQGPIGGTATRHIGQWNPSGFGTLVGGTVEDIVTSLAWTAGTLFAGGRFQTAGGTAARFVAEWVNNAWGTLTGGTVNNHVRALDIGLAGQLMIGGIFTSVAGSAIKYVAQWNGTMLPAGSGADGGGAEVDVLAVGPDGRTYVGGLFGTAGGLGGFNGIASFNGVGYTALGTRGADVYLAIEVDPLTNDAYIGASGSFNFEPYLTNLFKWNGNVRLPVDVRVTPITGDPDITTIGFAPDNTMYIGGLFAGSAIAGAVGTIMNSGRAQAYPTIRMRLNSGTARVYRIANTTTGNEICFNLVLQAGEVTTLSLTPGNRSFTSSYRGNIFSSILPGSNLATWSLLSGTNYVSFFTDNSALETAVYWNPRGWSIDSGTIV